MSSKLPEYVSPFDTRADGYPRYTNAYWWAKYRDEFCDPGTTDRSWALQQMLHHVTLDSPAEAPKPVRAPRKKPYDCLWFWILTAPFWIAVFIVEEITGCFF